jgi:hypothetical protein
VSAAARLGLLALLALAGCTIPQEIPEFPGAAAQIRRFYADNAFEMNATCTSPVIAAIIASRVVTETPERLVLEVRYRFEPFVRNAQFGRAACIDWNTRQFTFERIDGGLSIVGMTGEQRLGPRTQIWPFSSPTAPAIRP